MKKIVIIFVLLFLPILGGCWDKREVNELSIAVALGIDKNEEKGYMVSVQVLNTAEVAPSAIGGGGGYDTPVTTYSSSGEILFEALRKLTQQVPHKIYLAHLRMIVIGEEIAREGIYESLDFLAREPTMRNDFYIVVSKDCNAKDVLQVLTNTEKIPADMLFDSLSDSSKNWAATSKVTLMDLINDISEEGTQPTLTAVKILGNYKNGDNIENIQSIIPKTQLSFDGMAAFQKDKLIGWLDENESKGLNYIKGKVQNTIIVTNIENNLAGVELLSSKSDVVPQFFDNGPPLIQIKISGVANLAEVNKSLNFFEGNIFSKLEENTNEEIKKIIIKTIEKSQNTYREDIFGFGNILYKKNPKEWRKIKEDWKDLYPNIKVEVVVDIKLKQIGAIKNLSNKK